MIIAKENKQKVHTHKNCKGGLIFQKNKLNLKEIIPYHKSYPTKTLKYNKICKNKGTWMQLKEEA